MRSAFDTTQISVQSPTISTEISSLRAISATFSASFTEPKVPFWEPFLFYGTVSKYKYESFYLTGFGRILLLIKKPLTSHFLTFRRFFTT